ncbi:hypothetical protein BDZ91DRAFT_752967, partial [Kalaharituber pfeilii]
MVFFTLHILFIFCFMFFHSILIPPSLLLKYTDTKNTLQHPNLQLQLHLLPTTSANPKKSIKHVSAAHFRNQSQDFFFSHRYIPNSRHL